MPRKKVDAAPVLKDWQEVDNALKELGEIDRRVTRVNNAATSRIAVITEKLSDDTKDDLAREARLEKDLEEFTRANATSLEGRSRKLNHGTVFLKLTHPLKTLKDWTWGKVVEALERRNLDQFVKVTKAAQKDAIKAAELDAKTLSSIGVYVADEDAFNFELAETEAKSTA